MRRRLARALLSEHLVLGLSLAYFLVLLPFVPGLGRAENPPTCSRRSCRC